MMLLGMSMPLLVVLIHRIKIVNLTAPTYQNGVKVRITGVKVGVPGRRQPKDAGSR
jgi:hypothetical protein